AMVKPNEQGSDVAKTRQQIEAADEAGQQGFYGLAAGAAMHAAITAKMERYGLWLKRLASEIGPDAAAKIVVAALEASEEPPKDLEA
ncbi:MAG TPA: hypothetical protein VNG90_05265, partial [Candidatus Acidoferrum sp.]|nr:hypothetical protein [Candidatus Acidoferrum sp.]